MGPPVGDDYLAGILYFLSSLGIACVGYNGILKLGENPRSYVPMLLQLIGCESIGLVGLIWGLVTLSKGGQVSSPDGRNDGSELLIQLGSFFTFQNSMLCFAIFVSFGIALFGAVFVNARRRV